MDISTNAVILPTQSIHSLHRRRKTTGPKLNVSALIGPTSKIESINQNEYERLKLVQYSSEVLIESSHDD